MAENLEDGPEIYTRRQFLVWVIVALGSLIGAVLGGLGFTYFLSPAWRKSKEGWVDLGPIASLPENRPVKMDYIIRRQDGWLTVEGRSSAWLLRNGGDITAFNPSCTHLGCAYRWDEGRESFLCPCHTAAFSKTGEVISGPPPRGLDRYQAKVEGGNLYILPEEKKA